MTAYYQGLELSSFRAFLKSSRKRPLLLRPRLFRSYSARSGRRRSRRETTAKGYSKRDRIARVPRLPSRSGVSHSGPWAVRQPSCAARPDPPCSPTPPGGRCYCFDPGLGTPRGAKPKRCGMRGDTKSGESSWGRRPAFLRLSCSSPGSVVLHGILYGPGAWVTLQTAPITERTRFALAHQDGLADQSHQSRAPTRCPHHSGLPVALRVLRAAEGDPD